MTLVEACCNSVQTAVAAARFGAGRIELCGDGDGGTTPSWGVMAACRDALGLPIHVMIRPHTRGFVYDEADVDVMLRDIGTAASLGMDGVVLGPLHSDRSVNVAQLQLFVSAAGSLRLTFHRAFDATPNAERALDAFMDAGVQLVLTSGHARTAVAGAAVLRRHHEQAAGRIVILAGGGIRANNVRQVLRESSVNEIHARAVEPEIIRDLVQALEVDA